MQFYEKEKCPVCNKEFVEGDDIVTCPDCATPHHRECYNSIGHCFNSDKHGTDFVFEVQKKQEQKSEPVIKETRFFPPQSENNTEESTEQQKNPFVTAKPIEADEYKDSTQTIDDMPIADVATVVKTNIKRFIPKFVKNKKLSWNWGAFIFGPYYMFFRKMYKNGFIFMALSLIANLIVQGVYSQQISDFTNFINANYSSLTSADSEAFQKALTNLMPIYNATLPAFLILFAVSLVLHIIAGLFADSLYRSRVIEIIKNVDQKLDDGGIFEQNYTIFQGDTKLTQKDMRRLYLGKMGGTNIFAPALAFIVLDLLTSFISQL